MTKFLFAYKGGSMPEGEAEQAQVMAAWTGWFTRIGDAVADAGNPCSISRTVAADGSVGEARPASLGGYSIVSAASLDEAAALAAGCPVLNASGTVEVIEIVDMM